MSSLNTLPTIYGSLLPFFKSELGGQALSHYTCMADSPFVFLHQTVHQTGNSDSPAQPCHSD